MNSKNISKHLQWKISDWLNSIEDIDIAGVIRSNAIITGGALVSLLTNETPNDYDIYFKTFESCLEVAEYYAKQWNKTHPEHSSVEIKVDDDRRITAYIKSSGEIGRAHV